MLKIFTSVELLTTHMIDEVLANLSISHLILCLCIFSLVIEFEEPINTIIYLFIYLKRAKVGSEPYLYNHRVIDDVETFHSNRTPDYTHDRRSAC